MEGEDKTLPEEPQVSDNPNKNYKKILVIFVLLVIGIGVLLALVYKKDGLKTAYNSESPVPSASPNLNPNTGDLYGDIKVRLNEVIK